MRVSNLNSFIVYGRPIIIFVISSFLIYLTVFCAPGWQCVSPDLRVVAPEAATRGPTRWSPSMLLQRVHTSQQQTRLSCSMPTGTRALSEAIRPLRYVFIIFSSAFSCCSSRLHRAGIPQVHLSVLALLHSYLAYANQCSIIKCNTFRIAVWRVLSLGFGSDRLAVGAADLGEAGKDQG